LAFGNQTLLRLCFLNDFASYTYIHFACLVWCVCFCGCVFDCIRAHLYVHLPEIIYVLVGRWILFTFAVSIISARIP
jgi:hypothetical protein